MIEDFDRATYALITKDNYPGAAWLAHIWDESTDSSAAFTSRRHAENWLAHQIGPVPKPERTAPNQYYYEWKASQ